jgi:hypothetical protein
MGANAHWNCHHGMQVAQTTARFRKSQVAGLLNAGVQKDPHTLDRQMAAIALLRPGLTMVTRDTASPGFRSAQRYGLALLNPFS